MPSLTTWESRFKRGLSLIPKCKLDKAEADAAEAIFRSFVVPDIPGLPKLGEVCGDWFIEIVRALFGSYDTKTNKRSINEIFCLVPKKNGKSSYSSALMLTALLRNRRPAAEYVIVSPTIEISNIAFRQAKGAIAEDPDLSKIFWVRDNLKRIEHRQTGATLTIKAADTNIVTGGKQVGTLIDETHEFSRKSNAREIFVELRGALVARPDGFLMQISTQSKREPQGVFRSELNRARRVRDGKSKLPLLPIIYEWPSDWVKKERWRNPKYWHLVNPNIDRSVSREMLEQEFGEAANEGAEALSLFCSQHLNVEIGTRLGDDYWVGAEFWPSAKAQFNLDLDAIIDRCDVATIGIDGGGRDDLLGLAVIGRERDTRRWLHWARAWAHQKVLDRNLRIRGDLIQFANDGTLTLIDENNPQADIEGVCAIAKQLDDARLLPTANAIGLDPVGVTAIVDGLLQAGLSPDQIVAVTQGYRLAGTIGGVERKLSDGSFIHGDNYLMNWCVGNARTELRGNNIYITKQLSKDAKIDALMATFNSAWLMSRGPESKTNYYAENEIRVL